MVGNPQFIYGVICKETHEILFKDIEVGKEDSDFTFEVKEPEFASLDVESGNVTALKEGETAVCRKYDLGLFTGLQGCMNSPPDLTLIPNSKCIDGFI